MKIKKQQWTALVVALLLLFQGSAAAAISITAGAACVLDSATGDFYYTYNADTPLQPASMTKVMTLYIVFEKMSQGAFQKNTKIKISQAVANQSRNPDMSNVPLNAGQYYTVDELIRTIVVASSCSSCMALSEYIAGSQSAFVKLMNQKVGELGLEAYYVDVMGVSASNRITARSMALLANKLVTRFPDVLSYTSIRQIQWAGQSYWNTNKMLPARSFTYPGVDGLKTGTTSVAGACFTGTAQQNGIRLIAVTMKVPDSDQRFMDTKVLFDYGFAQAAQNRANNYLLATGVRTFLNGEEVPTFWYKGDRNYAVLILEDLKDYGFAIAWDPATQTVTAIRDENKAATPIPMGMYRSYAANDPMFKINKNAGITARIVDGDRTYTFQGVYPLGGYTAVSADEFASFADWFHWDQGEQAINIAM